MTMKSNAKCRGGCKCKRPKPVAEGLLKKEIARWKRERRKLEGKDAVMQAATGSVTSQIPPPPVSPDLYHCMSDWYYASMTAGKIDNLDAQIASLTRELDAEELKLAGYLQDLADCVGGMLV